MSRVSYFQRFHQPENHATNNTLLVLKYFNQFSSFRLQQTLTSLTGDQFEIGLTFQSQIKMKSSVPDALISQQPLNIYIETKLGGELDSDQIIRHIDGIAARSIGAGRNILIGLTKEPIAKTDADSLSKQAQKKGVLFCAITFSQIVDTLRGTCAEYERELIEIIADYEEYLSEASLLEEKNQWLAVFPCGQSFPENKNYNLYYEPPTRPCKKNRFIGIYTQKKVALIGSVDVIVVCSYGDGKIQTEVETGNLTSEHISRIKDVIEKTGYYDLKADPCRFYLVDKFVETDLRKESSGGMRGLSYLDLAKIVGKDFNPRADYTSEQIATLVNEKTFL